MNKGCVVNHSKESGRAEGSEHTAGPFSKQRSGGLGACCLHVGKGEAKIQSRNYELTDDIFEGRNVYNFGCTRWGKSRFKA